MRTSSDNLPEVLTGSFSRRLSIDVFHGADRVLQDIDITAWQLDGDLTSEVKHSGSATVVYASQAGESLVPNGTDGILSPYRATLLLKLEISAGNFTETVTLGWFKVIAAPSAYDEYVDDPVSGKRVVVSSVVEVEFQSLDVNLKRRGFRSPEQPPSLLSSYDEIRRISDMSVVETVPDKALSTALVYETTQGGRLKGVQDIASSMGGVAVPDSFGALRIITPGADEAVGTLTVGPDGTVTDIGYSIDTDSVYNCVVGTFEDANRNPIYAVAEVTTGPLATDGAYGEYTRYYSSPLVNTQAAADSAVKAILSQSIGGQTYDVPVKCILHPLIELGDPLEVTGHDRPILGQCVKYSMSDSALMDVTLEVPRPLT